MEHAQREYKDSVVYDLESKGLNPYFNGTCSKSKNGKLYCSKWCISVLILILMEHAQRDIRKVFMG